MRLAISNIAWESERTAGLLPGLRNAGIDGLVIAPRMIWPEAPDVNQLQAAEFRRQLADQGLVIFGMQSLVYGRHDVALFGSDQERRNLTDHLIDQVTLAGRLGARSLIFGSPGLRQANNLSAEDKTDIAAEVFIPVAEAAANEDTVLAIEPLHGYGNDFIANTLEGIKLVEEVDHIGFGLHLDSAAISGALEIPRHAMALAQDNVGIASFDASAPNLSPLTHDTTVQHNSMAAALRHAGYDGFVSIEMLARELSDAEILAEVAYARAYYGVG